MLPEEDPTQTDAEIAKTVLVIEDEPDLGWALSAALTHHGYNPILSTNGLTGLIKSRCHKPDCIVLDMALPRLHGLDVLHKLRMEPELEGVPVIVITGSLDPEFESAARIKGISALLRKPFRHAELLATIDDAVHGPSRV